MEAVLVFLFIGSCIGIWYFIKKKPNKKKRNISLGLLALSTILISIYPTSEEKTASKKPVTTSETTSISKEKESSSIVMSKSEAPSSESIESSSESEIQSNTGNYDAINAEIATHLSENQGFATGTLDANGNPTENGTPNPNFNWSLVVDRIEYAGTDGINVYVSDAFTQLSDDEKRQVAQTAQNAASAYIGPAENWDDKKYQQGIFTAIKNGGKTVGRSTAFDLKEFKWKK